jgi:predicted RNA-binding Zn ribbon-like protein
MTHEKLIPSNLPLYFQCLRAPCEVETKLRPRHSRLGALQHLMESRAGKKIDEQATTFYWSPEDAPAETYDPWEWRGRFFRIKEGDNESLIDFLRAVGLFAAPLLGSDPSEHSTLITAPDGQNHVVRYMQEMRIESVWGLRSMIENSLRELSKHTGKFADFNVRILLAKGRPRVTITTCTFYESLLLTLAVDRVERAKVRKCARPDCGILFSNTSAHKRKFCTWYCGHIESVRKQRREGKRHRKER